jgi:hypothetical protein
MSKETESTTFGITGVQHHLTSEKLDRIEKEIRAIDKEHKGKPFDLSRLIDSLETFIRAEFKDEPDPRSLARWFARQFEHVKVEGYDVRTGTIRPPVKPSLKPLREKPLKRAAAPCKN